MPTVGECSRGPSGRGTRPTPKAASAWLEKVRFQIRLFTCGLGSRTEPAMGTTEGSGAGREQEESGNLVTLPTLYDARLVFKEMTSCAKNLGELGVRKTTALGCCHE